MHLTQERSGFSLVEVSLMSLVLVTLGMAIMQCYLAFWSTFDSINANGVLQADLAAANETLSQDIQASVWAPTSCDTPNGTIVGDSNSLVDGRATLILMLPSINAQGRVIDPAQVFDYVIYTYDSAQSAQLRRLIYANPLSSRETPSEPDQTLVTANYIQQFQYDDPNVTYPRITFYLYGRKTEHGRSFTKTVITQGRFRNNETPS